MNMSPLIISTLVISLAVRCMIVIELKSKAKRRKKKYVEKRVGEAAMNSFTAFNLSATDDP